MKSDFEIIFPVIATLAGMIIGFIVTIFLSNRDRKHRKELLQLEISNKKEMFEIEKTQRQELFNLERKDKFRQVAIEKRLEAHQQALVYWYKLRDIYHEKNEEIRKGVIDTAYDFWYSNCLYLEKNTQKEFYAAIVIVEMNPTNILMRQESTDPNTRKEMNDLIKNNWDRFLIVHSLIFSEVELEPIKLSEKERSLIENQEE